MIYPVKARTDGVRLDVHIPTYGHLGMTEACMNALYSNTQTPFHLIVTHAPDSEDDLTEEWFKRLMKHIHNITFIERDSWKCGNQFFNEALKHTQTDYLVTMMNSVRAEPGWEVVALDIMKQRPEVGTIGFKCLYGEYSRFYGSIESAGIAMRGYTPVDIGKDLPGHRLNESYSVLAAQWAFAMHRVKALVGNLEENHYHGHVGWDDIDNSFVLRKKGWEILYCGMGAGYHNTRASRGDDSPEAAKKNIENAHTFYKRWGYWEMFCKDKGLNQAGQPTTKMAERKRKKR